MTPRTAVPLILLLLLPAIALGKKPKPIKTVKATVTIASPGDGWSLTVKLAKGTKLRGKKGTVVVDGTGGKVTLSIKGRKAPKAWTLDGEACTATKGKRSGRTLKVKVACGEGGDPDADANAGADRHGNGDAVRDREPDARADRDGDANPHGHGHGDRDGHRNRYGDHDGDAHVDPDRNAHRTTATAAAGTPYPVTPYADMTLGTMPDLKDYKDHTGVGAITLSFVTAKSGTQCVGAWGGVEAVTDTNTFFTNTLQTRLQAFVGAGGKLVLAFGGVAGTDLAQTCGSVADLKTAYQQAINQVSTLSGTPLTHIDLDVEDNDGHFSNTPTAYDNQAAAIAQMQAANPALVVTYTLQAEPTTVHDDYAGGMMTGPKAVVTSAKTAGVTFAAVNGMAMDYGGAYYSDGQHMGADAISVAGTIRHTLGDLYPGKTDAQLWKMVGITPMIGRNDIATELFYLPDMTQLVTFAKSKMGRCSASGR